jgi:hypothetical protein
MTNPTTSTLNKYYESLKSCETIDELDQKYKIIHEDRDLTLREYHILTDIYNYQKIIIPTLITPTITEIIKMNKPQQLNEFMTILKTKNRKDINAWKEKNYLMIETGLYSEKVCNDIDVIYHLSGNEIMEYMDHLSDDLFDNSVKWKSTQKKKQFYEKF